MCIVLASLYSVGPDTYSKNLNEIKAWKRSQLHLIWLNWSEDVNRERIGFDLAPGVKMILKNDKLLFWKNWAYTNVYA